MTILFGQGFGQRFARYSNECRKVETLAGVAFGALGRTGLKGWGGVRQVASSSWGGIRSVIRRV